MQAFCLFFYHMYMRGRKKDDDDDDDEVDINMGRINILKARYYIDMFTVWFYLFFGSAISKTLLYSMPIVKSLFAVDTRLMLANNVACFVCDYYLKVPHHRPRHAVSAPRARDFPGALRLGPRCTTGRTTKSRRMTAFHQTTSMTTTTTNSV